MFPAFRYDVEVIIDNLTNCTMLIVRSSIIGKISGYCGQFRILIIFVNPICVFRKCYKKLYFQVRCFVNSFCVYVL